MDTAVLQAYYVLVRSWDMSESKKGSWATESLLGTPATAVRAESRNRGRVQFTTAAYERTHGRQPRGTGNWAFRQAGLYCHAAYEADLFGPVVFAYGTLAQAERDVAARYPNSGLWAVMP